MKDRVSLESARASKSRAAEAFRSLLGEEVSVGLTRVGEDGYALKVNLAHDPGTGVDLPDEIDGVPVRIEVVGRIRKR